MMAARSLSPPVRWRSAFARNLSGSLMVRAKRKVRRQLRILESHDEGGMAGMTNRKSSPEKNRKKRCARPVLFPTTLAISPAPEGKFAERCRNMKIRRGRSGWPPCRIEARLARPFNAKEISAPSRIGIELCRQAFHRQGKFRRPALAFLIHPNTALQPALQVMFFPRRDIQINPEPVRAHFKLFVAAWIGPGGLQENFGDIAVPQVIAPAAWFGVIEHGDAAIMRHKPEKECFRGPKHAHLCLKFRIGISSLPIVLKPNRRSILPRLTRWKPFPIGLAGKLHRRNCVASES